MSVKERSHNYEQAFRALQERLASGDTEEAIKSYGEQLLKQIGQSKQLGHFSLDALTSVLCELNQTITTQTLTHAIDCLHYYEMRLALDDTLSMQPKNELIRVSGKSILEQIIRLKASPRFPLIELWQVLVIIDGAINAQNRNNHAVVNLIHYYKARLALQESLSKQRIINTLKRGAEALLRQITQLQRSAALSLDELTESLEAVNAIINLPTGIGDQAMDCLHYEQARLMLRTTLTDPKTVPLLISYGESVLEKTEQVKASPQ